MGCSSSKTLQEEAQTQGWVDSFRLSFKRSTSVPTAPQTAQKHSAADRCQTVAMTSSFLQTLKMEGQDRRDLRSLMLKDKSWLHADEHYTDAVSELSSDEPSERNSESKATAVPIVKVKVANNMTIQTAAKGFEISDIVNVPNETQDLNKNLASSYPDYSQKFVRLQNGGQDIHDVERKCSRITLKDILKGQAFSNQTDFSAAVHEASEKENTELAAEQFQNQAAKLQKEKRLLPSIFRAKFNSRKESKAKEIGNGTRKRSVSIKKQSFIDLSEKDRNASKAVPKLAERSTSVKDLFYGATFRNLEQGPQTNLNLTPVKIPPKGPLSLEKLKIGDNGYSTFSPDDLQSTGSTRFDSSITHSFDTAEEQFSGDDCSQESVAVSASSLSDVRSPFKRKCLFEAEKKKLPSRTLSGMVRTSTAESRDTLSIYSRDVTSEIDEVDRMHVETSPLGQFEFLCPPGGEEQVVLYTTSLRGIRKTYEECSSVRTILQGFSVRIDERDISMHSGFKQELKNLLTEPAHVPRLFIKGRHIGGAEEVLRLNENGILIRLLESLPKYVNRELCRGCGGVRFVPCPHCAGSCKIVSEGKKVVQCPNCNENGLIRCPICC